MPAAGRLALGFLVGGRTTLYGSAYFLSSKIRMNQLLVPLYSISAMRSSAAAECSTGRLTRLMTLVRMTASRSVQLPAWHSGSSSPCGPRGSRQGLGLETQHITM